MCIQTVRMLATWTKCSTSFILYIRCLLNTEVCVCTDVGRMFSEQIPTGSSVWGQTFLGEVEMFSMLLYSRWRTLLHLLGRACAGPASSKDQWVLVQCYSKALLKIPSMVECRLFHDSSSFGTVIPPRHMVSMTPSA